MPRVFVQFPGCQQACQFFTQSADVPQKDPVMPTSAEPTVKLVGNLASWPRPSDRNSKREKERLVYAVIQKQSTGRWRQIIQVSFPRFRSANQSQRWPRERNGSARCINASLKANQDGEKRRHHRMTLGWNSLDRHSRTHQTRTCARWIGSDPPSAPSGLPMPQNTALYL